MFTYLKSAFGRHKTDAQRVVPAQPIDPAPQQAFVAVGDVHGRADLLDILLGQIAAEYGDTPLVFLGDYIDRGPDSADVLARWQKLQTQDPARVICLMGNHERMMLQFIDDPLGKGAFWLAVGGVDTLASYGIRDVPKRPAPEVALDTARQLEAALPEGTLDWLRALAPRWSSGNMHCVHAAMDPAVHPDLQQGNVMLWGHQSFLSDARSDAHCVVHGHTPLPQPFAGNSRIAIDTGAYKTGTLSAVHVSPGAWEFIQT